MREYKIIEMPTFPKGAVHYEVSIKTYSKVFTWVHLRNFSTKKEAEEYIKKNPSSAEREL